MQVVINIDEVIYKRILPYKDVPVISNLCNDYPEITHAIANGVPLPKGHGALKDVNDLLKMTESYKSELGRLKADPFVKSGIETVESFIKEIPTIIKADRSEV